MLRLLETKSKDATPHKCGLGEIIKGEGSGSVTGVIISKHEFGNFAGIRHYGRGIHIQTNPGTIRGSDLDFCHGLLSNDDVLR